MITQEITVQEDFTLTDLLVWCDNLEDRGYQTDVLRQMITKGFKPSLVDFDSGPVWIWYDQSAPETSSVFDFNSYYESVLPRELLAKIKIVGMDCRNMWIVRDNSDKAWMGLVHALQGYTGPVPELMTPKE